MVQIRNVPDAPHPRLKSRAALARMSLSADLLNAVRDLAERPTIQARRIR
jgi:plasmid stability protein